MAPKYKIDWILPVLDDLAAFLDANEMPKTYKALQAAVASFKSEQGRLEDAPNNVVELRGGNVVAFRFVRVPNTCGDPRG